MDLIVAEETVKEKVNLAESILDKCFNMLLDIKHATESLGKAIVEFQPLLADCLLALMEFYHELQGEKKIFISQKETYSPDEFAICMQSNAKHLKIIGECIKIGKSLGDAFAWFFYHKNRAELDMHLEHPSTGLFPSGIGGKGELAFIKNNQNLDGLFVVYHGITDMLRIGDFSLYAGNSGIVGVGELKTIQEGGHLKVSANITSKVNISAPEGAEKEAVAFPEKVKELAQSFPQLPKQLELQDKVVGAKSLGPSSNHYADYEYYLIDSISPENPVILNKDNSLLICAIWSSFTSLYGVLSTTETVNTPPGLSDAVLTLMKPESPYNSATLSELDLRLFPPRIPILWWKIDDRKCKDIYFKRVSISTVFNPAKLLQRFLDEGFCVSCFGRLQDIKLERDKDGKRIEFGHMQMFCDMISQSLMTTDAVFSMIQEIVKNFESGAVQPGTKVDMHIHLNNFGTMPDE